MAKTGDYGKNLEALERIMACLNTQYEIIGKGSTGLLYQAGKDVGKTDGMAFDRTDDIATAIRLIKEGKKDVWNVEVWTESGQSETILKEEDYEKVFAVFRECPIRQVCVSQGVEQNSAMCRIAHGYYAGLLASIIEKRVDVKVVEVGPNACKKEIIWR
ncbi:MAG: hypothetical protein JSW52_01555 [Candidatus Coatesbacteria bacterium]|nr:MAG: hypothetical protein JSW52_01555 [Candidatus Coatesbacteria bacterium]